MKYLFYGVALLFVVFLLVGCDEGTVVYKGKERPVAEVEEIIADELEVENPGEDLGVDIFAEQD